MLFTGVGSLDASLGEAIAWLAELALAAAAPSVAGLLGASRGPQRSTEAVGEDRAAPVTMCTGRGSSAAEWCWPGQGAVIGPA
jgi:hypothetical protein